MKLTNFRHGVGQNAYHFVWKPKYAKPVFAYERLRISCENALKQIAKKHGFEIYELQVMPDHIHLFVEVPPAMSVSKALQLFKGGSAYKLFRWHPSLRRYKNFRKGFWSPGKFFRSVGNVTADVIQHYIAQSQGSWSTEQKSVSSFAN